MMGRRAVFSLFILLSFGAATSTACTCAGTALTVCAGLKGLDSTGPIFVGTVLEIHRAPGDPRVVTFENRFRVDENLVGADTSQIVVSSGLGGGDCGFPFKQNQQYLVFSYRTEDGRLMTTSCSLTRSIAFASAILPQLRAMRDKKRVANLYGLLEGEQNSPTGGSEVPAMHLLTNTRVELRSDDKSFVSITDSNGAYAFYNVPAGKYRLFADLPGSVHTAFADSHPPLQVPNSACYEYNALLWPTGRISGRVLDPDGKPLSYETVSLYRRDKYPAEEQRAVASQGIPDAFEFDNLDPGDYVLVYNSDERVAPDVPFPRTFYPNVSNIAKARVIHLKAGQKVDGIDIRLSGGRATRQLTVKVESDSGPLPDVHYLEIDGWDGSLVSAPETSPGVYVATLFKDLKYRLIAGGACLNTTAPMPRVTSDPVDVDGSDESVTEVTIPYKSPDCPKQDQSSK